MDADADCRANSGCFLLVRFNTSSDWLSFLSMVLASILDNRVTLQGSLFMSGCKLDAENDRSGDSCAMAGLSAKCCE